MKDTRCGTESRWDGSYYANHSDWQYRLATVALSFIQLSPSSRILDIGCGDGRVTKYIASLVPDGSVLGLDSSPLMLSAAQANAGPNLSFILGDAVTLPFKNQFDFVVSFNCLHWVSEIKTAIEQVRAALFPGGKALILVAPIQVRHPIHQIIDEIAKRNRWSSHFDNASSVFPFHTLAKWASIIEEAGMIPEHLQLIGAPFDFPNKKVFADWVAGWVPLGTIPQDKRGDYVHEIVEAYTSATLCEAKGVVHYNMDELVVVASTHERAKHSI